MQQRKKTIHKTIISFGLLLILGLIWGTGYSIARFAMTHEVPPLGYSFWQSIGPAIIMITITAFYLKPRKPTPFHLYYYFICGLTGIFIPNTIMYIAAAHLPASLLAMVVNTVPVIAYPMALMMKTEYFHWQRLSGIVLAFIGIMFIILPKTSLPGSHLVPWILFTLITPFSFAFCSVFIAKYRPAHTHTLALTTGMLVVSSLLLIPIVASTHSFYPITFPLDLADKIIILEIILSSIGYLLFFQLIKIAGPVFYSLVDTVVVITGIAWGYYIFGEQLNQWTATAVIFILLAIILVTQKQPTVLREKKASHED